MKRQLNVRVSEYTRKQLTAVCAATGLNEAGVITLAIDRLTQQLVAASDASERIGVDVAPPAD